MAAPSNGGGFLNQGFTIAGHKISWAAVGALAAAVGVVVVMRAKASSSNVVSAGSAPTTSYAVPTLDTGLTSQVQPDYTAQLEDLTQQVSGLQQQLQTAPAAPQLVTTAATDTPAGFPGGFPNSEVPVFSENKAAQGVIGYLQPNVPLTGATAAQGFGGDSGFTIDYGAQQGFVPGRYTQLEQVGSSVG